MTADVKKTGVKKTGVKKTGVKKTGATSGQVKIRPHGGRA